MADSREVFAFPELSFFCWNGASSGLLAYAQSVEVTVDIAYQRYLLMITGTPYADRTRYVETDSTVRMAASRMYAGASTFQLMNSGVNISAVAQLVNGADGATAKFILWSARITQYQMAARDGSVLTESVQLIAPDVSGL